MRLYLTHDGIEYAAEVNYTRGVPAVRSGPPDNWSPGEPPEVEVLEIGRVEGKSEWRLTSDEVDALLQDKNFYADLLEAAEDVYQDAKAAASDERQARIEDR